MPRATAAADASPVTEAPLSRLTAAPTSGNGERASSGDAQAIGWPARMVREILAGIAACVAILPTCLSSALLAYAPFGPGLTARGAAAGLIGAIAGGFFAALTARSSFIISIPRPGGALALASLAAVLLADPLFAGNPALCFLAMAVCLLLAGLWQVAFGALGVANLIKFTPHPVLAGFINGVALLIALGAFHILWRGAETAYGALSALAFAAVLTVVVIYFERRKTGLPAPIAGLAIGMAAFYVIRELAPGLPLGPTVGALSLDVNSVMSPAADGGVYAALRAEAPAILLTSLVIAVVTSLETLLVARMIRNLGPLPPDGARFLLGQGIGNVAAAALGGIAISAGPSQSLTAFRAGGRTRLTGLSAAVLLLIVGALAPGVLAAIPQVVLCAILFANSILVVDPWSLRLLRDAFRAKTRRGSIWKNLAVIVAVTAITGIMSVTEGVMAGIVLSCLIFIVSMSRPLVRRRQRGDKVFSQRVRPERDVEILRRVGHRRAVLELQGVMFFGNTDDLCTEIETLFGDVDIILLDCRRVADIDISAIGALEQAVAKARAARKHLLFCHMPELHMGLFATNAEAGSDTTVFGDLDTALEWMEETVLREEGASEFEELPLDQIEFLHGLDAREIAEVRKHLMPMSFPGGGDLCRQGEEADYLWILSSGSVSIWVDGQNGQGAKRIAGLARGTIVGEMALLEGGRRSATVRADEDVTGYMIDRETFDALLLERPRIGGTILINIAREMARRLRRTSQAFSAATV
ncbi:MAG TPA: SulP family inorganic anion transporter [Alphaproteobacteria bacterium]